MATLSLGNQTIFTQSGSDKPEFGAGFPVFSGFMKLLDYANDLSISSDYDFNIDFEQNFNNGIRLYQYVFFSKVQYGGDNATRYAHKLYLKDANGTYDTSGYGAQISVGPNSGGTLGAYTSTATSVDLGDVDYNAQHQEFYNITGTLTFGSATSTHFQHTGGVFLSQIGNRYISSAIEVSGLTYKTLGITPFCTGSPGNNGTVLGRQFSYRIYGEIV